VCITLPLVHPVCSHVCSLPQSGMIRVHLSAVALAKAELVVKLLVCE
jgi:hypothetical protein